MTREEKDRKFILDRLFDAIQCADSILEMDNKHFGAEERDLLETAREAMYEIYKTK